MKNKKELIQSSYLMGKSAFPEYGSAPYLNFHFMSIVPNCNFEDEKGTKLRISMYKSYIKGWTEAHVNSMII